MSRVETRITTTLRHEYIIDKPGYRKDIYEACSWAERDLKNAGQDSTFDDAFMITSTDEHIIVYWEEKVSA